MPGKTHRVYIGAGSNIGNRAAFLRSARNLINDTDTITVTRTSGIYETQPYGYSNQGLFLNCVFELETEISPRELLAVLLHIEKVLKRKRLIHWGPRTIDLDILFYDDLVLNTEILTIPHRELHKRLFVLTPLTDLVPDFVHPVLQESCSEIEEKVKKENTLAVEAYPSGIDI